ncbi:MAG: hypothetical protein HY904_07915 [Deltaproteobacteria bacterium]|nr:hypothetical protein [Deltaproteobacteria bacterium]
MRTNRLVGMGLSALLGSGCAAVDTLTALQKATYAEATDSTSHDALGSAPTNDGSATETEATDLPPLLQDCTLPAAERRVRDRCDTNGDGTMDADEEAALEEQFPREGGGGGGGAGQGPGRHGGGGMGMPGEGGGAGPGAGGGQGGPRPGEGGPHGEPQCQGPMVIADMTAHPPRRGPPRPEGWHKLMFIYDADDSRTLDQDERATLEDDLRAGCQARNANLLTRFDTDGDGTLSDAETQAARDAMHQQRLADITADLTAADADADGSLSCDEQRAFREARRAEHMQQRAQFDTNGNHRMDDNERAALRAAVRARIRAGELPGGPQ